MFVRFTVECECNLDPEDAERIENGEMTIHDIDWYFYMQDSDMTLASIEEG